MMNEFAHNFEKPAPGEESPKTGGPESPTPPPDAAPPAGPAADPFDPASLRLTQDFLGNGAVKKHITSVPARKPTKEEWIAVHPSADYVLDALVLELKNSGETFLVGPHLHGDLAAEKTVSARRIFTAVNRQGGVFLWPARLPPPDGRQDRWAESALEAAQEATRTWVRIQADTDLGAYVYWTPTAELSGPDWPEMGLGQLLKLAYRNNYIDSLDHLVLRRLRGEV
jgi:hypothetical protein